MLATSGIDAKDADVYGLRRPACMFYLPGHWSSGFSRKRRKTSIFLALPDALDLLVVCVEAGLGSGPGHAQSERGNEEARAGRHCRGIQPVQFPVADGPPANRSAARVGLRAPASTICAALAAILIQADKFGSSVAQALRVQSDSMRTGRRQLAEEKAAKTAVKLIFPLVIFIFPGIFVVLVGPAAITMVREMFPAMGAH